MADALLVGPRAEIADTSALCSAGRLLVVGLETTAVSAFAPSQAMVSTSQIANKVALRPTQGLRPCETTGIPVATTATARPGRPSLIWRARLAGNAAGTAASIAWLRLAGHHAGTSARPLWPPPSPTFAAVSQARLRHAFVHEEDLRAISPDHIESSRHHPSGIGPYHTVAAVADATGMASASRSPFIGATAASRSSPASARTMDQEEARHLEEVGADRSFVAAGRSQGRVVALPQAEAIVEEDLTGVLVLLVREVVSTFAVRRPRQGMTDVLARLSAAASGLLQV